MPRYLPAAQELRPRLGRESAILGHSLAEKSRHAAAVALALDPTLFPLLRALEDLAGSLDELVVLRTGEHLERFESDHRHVVPTLVLPLRGVVRVSTAQCRLDLLPGSCLLIEPLVAHQHVALRPSAAFLHQGFMPAWSDVSIMAARRWSTGTVPTEPSLGLFRRALAAAPALARQHLREALRQLLDGGITPLKEPHPAVWKMANRIWWHGLGRLQAADALRASGLPARSAHRLFTDYFGLTPKQEISRRQRLSAQALHEAGLPRQRIIKEIGCSDGRMLDRCLENRQCR